MPKKAVSAGVSTLKSRAPFLPPVIRRETLFARLDERAGCAITWIVAPPGAGKTTLVASYLATQPSFWYQLDASDADIASFLRHLGQAVSTAHTHITLPTFTPEAMAGLPVFIRDYFLLLGQHLRGTSLVLDNYQDVAGDGPFHALLAEGIRALVGEMRIFIISREEAPAPFAPLAAAGLLTTLGADALRLTREEAREIARLRGDRQLISEAVVETLCERSHGWTAGLILMLEQLARSGDVATIEDIPHSTFHYFARDAFAGVPESARAQLAVAALLPVMTKPLLQMLTGTGDSLHAIERLWQRNYFTQRLAGGAVAYRFHPLFRAFLRQAAVRYLEGTRWAAFKGRAAHLLEQQGEVDEAAALYAEMADWHGLEEMLVRAAPELFAEGRLQTLQFWIGQVPAERHGGSGWLNYWQGICLLYATPQVAVRYFDKAATLFEVAADAVGRALAIAGLIDAHVVTQWARFEGLDRWIAALEQHLERHDLPAQVMAPVTASMFAALMFRQPDHPLMDYWYTALERLIHEAAPARKLTQAHMLMLFLSWRGDLNRMGMLYETLLPASRQPDLPPVPHILFHLFEGVYRMFTGEPQAGLAANQNAAAMARQHGIAAFNGYIHANSAHAAFSMGDPDAAGHHLDLMGQETQPDWPLAMSHYHYLRTLEALHRRNWARAEEQSRRAFELSVVAGAQFPLALNRLLRAVVMLRTGRLEEADEQQAFAAAYAERMNSDYLRVAAAFITAQLALQRREYAAMLAALRRMFGICRLQGFWNYDALQPDLMADLCVHALEADIETGYVREFIRRRGLPLPAGGDMGGHWPWPVRIHALGGFAVVCADQTLSFSSKAQRRPLTLLKHLVVHGARGVSTAGLAEALWPDARGDTANVLDVTLHRLRKLLGRHDAILLEDGRLRINDQCVWLDSAWFERGQRRLQGMLATVGATVSPQVEAEARRVVSLYRGALLKGEEAPAYLLARERLAARFRALLLALGRHWEAVGEWRRAIELYERGLEEFPAVEEFYLRIMHCQQARGARAEAVATFRRCQRNLSLLLGVEPSATTGELLQALLAQS